MMKKLFFITLVLTLKARAFSLSIETDPLFFVGSKNSQSIYDLNVDFKFDSLKSYRLGIFAWSGNMNSSLSDLLLPDSLATQITDLNWTGYGFEFHYMQNPDSSSGSLLYGIRLQNNSYKLKKSELELRYEHQVITPQIGYQYFLSNKTNGFYLLPWAGAQIPVSGDNQITDFNGLKTESKKVLPILTVHIGYEF